LEPLSLAMIASRHALLDEIGPLQSVGHGPFLSAGLAWAFYAVAMRKARLDGLHAAAISAVGSMILYLPVFAFLPGSALSGAPWSDLALQVVVQGVFTAIISLLLYGRAVSILGASSGAAFAALCPALTALFGIRSRRMAYVLRLGGNQSNLRWRVHLERRSNPRECPGSSGGCSTRSQMMVIGALVRFWRFATKSARLFYFSFWR
jgi:EamA-like transporter family protein